MQRIGDEFTVIDPNGNAVPGATIAIYDSGTSTLSSVYSATDIVTPTVTQANPFTTDTYGRWRVALPDGRYDIQVSGGSFPTYTIPKVCVFDNTITYPSPMLGTVTSVAVGVPAEFTASAPITGSGTITIGYGSWAASKLIIAPVGGGTPTLRNLVVADLPSFGPTATTTFGSATQVAQVNTDARGIITSISNVTVTPAWTNVTSKPTTISGYAITDGIAVLFRQTATVSIYSSTTETTMVGAGQGSTTISANRLVAGSTIRVRLFGTMGNNPTMTWRLKLKLGSQTLLDTGAVSLSTSVNVGSAFTMEFVYTVRTTGAGGTGIGQVFLEGGAIPGVFPAAGFAGTSSIDTTTSGAVDVTFQAGTNNANDGITVQGLNVYLEA